MSTVLKAPADVASARERRARQKQAASARRYRDIVKPARQLKAQEAKKAREAKRAAVLAAPKPPRKSRLVLNCPTCGGLKRRYPSGQYHCAPCQNAKSAARLAAKVALRPAKMWACGCGNVIPASERPRGVSGHALRHCGCLDGRLRFASLPPTVRERSALAKAGDPLALEWRADWLEKKKQARARAAAIKGKSYRRIEHVREARLGAVSKTEFRRAAKEVHKATIHDSHVLALRGLSEGDEWRWRYRNDPAFNAKERIRRQLRKKLEAVPGIAELLRAAVRTGRANSKVELVLGCSIEQFKQHIERQFSKGMGWDVWSKNGMHIDHILPRKCFDLTTIDGVQAYWSLSNLRPLWAKDNLRKGHKLDYII